MDTKFLISGVALITAVGAACSANSGDQSRVPGAGGSGQGGASAAGGTINPGGRTSTGGAGGSIIVDGGGGSSGGDPDAACQAVSQTAKTALTPADIVWAVDTSCSMLEEAAAVQANLNAFSQQISASGIDVHVVLISSYPSVFTLNIGVCVDPPLGKPGGCPSSAPGSDNNLPHFFHDPNPSGFPGGMQSTDGLNVLQSTFPTWSSLLRQGATHWVAIVTDDDAKDAPYGAMPPDQAADAFIADFKALSPLLSDFKMSGVYAFSACDNAASVSERWKAIIDKTGGVPADICNCGANNPQGCAQTFQSVFNELAIKIVEGSKPIDCEWAIPAPPQGQQFDPEKVNVELIDQMNGSKEIIYHVADQAGCDPVLGGWYYDNNAAPTKVISCPSSCDVIKGTTQGKLDVLFGCATQDIPR